MYNLHAIYWERCRSLFLVERIFHRQVKIVGLANNLITSGPIPGESQARPLQARKKGIFFNCFCVGQSTRSGENLLKEAKWLKWHFSLFKRAELD